MMRLPGRGMIAMYTKEGKPLQVSFGVVYSRSGKVVGRISGDKVYGPNGRYVGTIDGERLVYRFADRAGMSSPFSVAPISAKSLVRVAPVAIWGDEPQIPD